MSITLKKKTSKRGTTAIKQEKVTIIDIPVAASKPEIAQIIPIGKIRTRVTLREFAKIATCGKGKNTIPLQELIVETGNLKIPSTTAIFNLTSAHDCPSLRLGLCQAVVNGKNCCYAKRAEFSYRPHVLPFRRRQASFWKTVTAEQFASQFMTINALKDSPFNALRFSEAGDFNNQKDVEKMEKIARYLKKDGVRTYCYTARKDLYFGGCRDLVVNGSGFMINGNEFRLIVDISKKPKGYGVCNGNCRTCSRCLVKGSKTVIVRH